MLFSIITVYFNSAKTIRKSFDSVLAQSYKDSVYLVIDGALIRYLCIVIMTAVQPNETLYHYH